MKQINKLFNNEVFSINRENFLEVLENNSIEYFNNSNIPVSFANDGSIISYWNDNNWIFCSLREKNYILCGNFQENNKMIVFNRRQIKCLDNNQKGNL